MRKLKRVDIIAVLVLSVLFVFLSMQLVNGAIYNTTNITNANNLYEQALAINSLTDYALGYAILAIIFAITFAAITGYSDGLSALTGAAWITAISATLFLPLGLIPESIYIKLVVLLGLAGAVAVVIKK